MTIEQLLGVAAGLSLLAGWRLYLCLFAMGLALKAGLIAPPAHFAVVQMLAHPWVISLMAIAALAECISDKTPWLDSLWDAAHGVLRPIGGAGVALAIGDPSQPVWQIITLLLGAGGAMISHRAKAGSRAIINASPEPFSNITVSLGEDIVAAGLLILLFFAPVAAGLIAGLLILGDLALIAAVRRMLDRMFTPPKQTPPA